MGVYVGSIVVYGVKANSDRFVEEREVKVK